MTYTIKLSVETNTTPEIVVVQFDSEDAYIDEMDNFFDELIEPINEYFAQQGIPKFASRAMDSVPHYVDDQTPDIIF